MSTLTDQIKAKCTTIAQNLKKVYDKGFADGKASVKHITFTILSEGEAEYPTFCAFAGMTWREYVTTDMCTRAFNIINDKICYYGDWLGCNADDEIVDEGFYTPFKNILYGTDEFYISRSDNFEDMVEKYNKDKYYVDDLGYIRAKDGRMLTWAEGVGACQGVLTDNYYDEMLSYWLSPDTDVIIFTLDYYSDAVAKRGCTWAEYCENIAYSNGTFYVNGDSVTNQWGEIIQLDGVNVLPSDVIVEGATYSFYYGE